MKNKVKDLSEEQLDILLESVPDKQTPGREVTLREFIKENSLEESTLTELLSKMDAHRILWPFRTVSVTVEVTLSLGYELAVLDDETIEDLHSGKLDIDEIDPDFTVDKAREEIMNDPESCGFNLDYAVMDDGDCTIKDWD
ncbi:MAG: hypothetical protein IJH11_08355 [Lachnospiraceae bacterium]|nr:hypothetical protein [Lachnospiraceae bacterium]